MPDADLRLLLAEALDLCVRARKLDEQTNDAALAEVHKRGTQSGVTTRRAAPFLWVIDQYERDLADWEKRARKALS